MIRVLALTFFLASTAGRSKRDPPVVGPSDPIEEAEEVVSIRVTPGLAGDPAQVKIVITVSDTTGLMLPGREVEQGGKHPHRREPG